jgi:chromosome segregation ATPase
LFSKTPESCLKIRLSALEKDYNELVTYTRDEDNIFMERANQLEKELKVANEKLFRYEHDEIVATELKKRFQVREEELVGRIAELEENIRKKEAHKNEDDNYNVDYISEQLICLYNILYSGNVKYDLDVTLTDKDEVISALKKENDKLRQNCFNANETHNFLKSEIEKMKTNNNKVLSEVENSCIANKQQMGKIEDSSNGKELEELITSVDKLKFEVVEKDRIISELQNSCALLTNEIEQMRSNVEKLSRELLEKNQSLSDVENNYTAIKRDMEKLEEDSFNSKEAYRHELDELKLNTDKLTLEIVEKDRIISELQSLRGENEKIPDDGELRSEELKKFKAKAEELAEKISSLSEVENNYDAIKRDMEKMKEDFTNSKKSHIQELDELQTKADKLTLEIVEKDGIISEMQNSCALLRNENEKMLMDSESCREELNKFKSNVEQLNRELLERNESLSEVENNYSAIKRDMEKLEQDVSNTKEAYRQQLDELQTKADKLTLEIVEKDRIISQLQSLGSENEKIQDDDELRSEELKKFKAKAEELTEKISALSEVENKYDAIKRVMKKMKEDFSNSKKSHMQELYEIQTKTDKLTLEIVEKDRIISEMQNSYTLLRNENEKMLMDSESCREDLNKFKLNVEQLSRELQERNESFSAVENNYIAIKREMEKLKKDVSNSKEAYREELDELRINADKLTLEIVEKNSIIFELENKCTVLRNENEKILIDSESCEELKKFKSRADELSLLLLEKNKALSEVENQMKCKVERLTREIIEQQNNCGQLQQKMETLNKEFSRVCNENTFLKSEVDKLLSELKDKDKKVSSIESDCASLREELENTKQDFCNISLKNKQFQSNIEKMKCTIADYETNCHLKEQKLKLSELKIQKQKQLLSNAQTQISDLKASIAEKETLKYDISQYQLELRESNKKLAECVQLNEHLTAELKILRENDSDKNYLSIDGVQEKDVATSDLLQKFETLLSLIVTHITNEQSTLLLKRHSQDQREYFKDFTRDLKSNNANLKHEFKTLRERKDCDFDKIAEYLVKSISIFGKYFKLEKSLLQSQIDQLESNNKAYLQEIIVLKDKQQDSNRIGNLEQQSSESSGNCFCCRLLPL